MYDGLSTLMHQTHQTRKSFDRLIISQLSEICIPRKAMNSQLLGQQTDIQIIPEMKQTLNSQTGAAVLSEFNKYLCTFQSF